jgi:hypothetical protein
MTCLQKRNPQGMTQRYPTPSEMDLEEAVAQIGGQVEVAWGKLIQFEGLALHEKGGSTWPA